MNELRELIESKLKLVEAKDKNTLAGFEFTFVKADMENSNKRTYSSGVVEKELGRFNSNLQKSKIAGQLNHPVASGTELDKVSHVITAVEYDKETKLGKAKALILNTTAGRNTKTLIDAEVSFGASMRGSGTVNKITGQVNNDWKLATVDLVAQPSFGSQTMITKANLIESGNQILNDAFFSMRDELSTAVKEKFGKDYWIVDFSPSEVVFRKDGATEDEYQKISYKIKGKEIELTGDAETVKKAIQYEDKEMKKKNKHKGLTLDDIKRLRPDLLKEHKSEVLIEEEALLYKRFVEAQEGGYKGTFEDYKKMVKAYKPQVFNESDLSQAGQDNLKFEREQKKKAEPLKEAHKRYDEAVMAGYTGSFEDWQKAMEEGKKKLELKEAASSGDPFYAAIHSKEGLWPHELQTAAKLERELLRKAEVKRYLEDVEKGLWLGSFREWQLDKREEQLRKSRNNLDLTYPR